jgi:replicative DNA helicase
MSSLPSPGFGNGKGGGGGNGNVPFAKNGGGPLSDHLPPQNLEAERSVLGGILLDNDVLHEVAQFLTPDDFYRDAHQVIFRAISDLYSEGKAIDAITLADELTRRDQYKQLGGDEMLLEIANSVPHAANTRYHAEIVRQKSISRQLIQGATDIIRDGYSNLFTAQQLLEAAEQKIFAIAEDQIKGETHEIKNVLELAMDLISKRAEEQHPVLGVASGFHELDDVTNGFHSHQLVIIAARPSMGKTALALNICDHAAMSLEIPVLLVSLEMGELEIGERLLCARSRVDGHKLRTGHGLGYSEMSKLAKAFGDMQKAPIFIDSTPARNMLQITAMARRLKMRHNLGLIVVDYIQLIDAEDSRDSRQEQIAKISRRLKTLARELHVPVIALSQLNRAVESREDRRPRMADLRECVTGDTLVLLADGRRVPISNLAGATPTVLAMSPEGKIIPAVSDKVWCVGRRPIFKVRLRSGRGIRATAEHRLYGAAGWVTIGDLQPGDRVALARRLLQPDRPEQWPEGRLVLLGHLIGDGSYLKHQPLRYTTASEENSRAVEMAAISEFGATVHRHAGRGNWHQLVFSGNGNRWHPRGIGLWLREMGIFDQRSHEKRVPSEVFRLSNDQLALLLRHLWATDGCIWVRPEGLRGSQAVYFATASQSLAYDVAALLLRLGIVSQVRTVTNKPLQRPLFQVRVTGSENQAKFLHIVGAFGPRREMAARLRTDLAGRKFNPNIDTLPHEIFLQVRSAMRDSGISIRRMAALRGTSCGGMSHFRFAPSRATIRSYAEILDNDDLRRQAETDLFWDTVVEISPQGEDDVFDLTVPGPSSWLADGIVTHNSGAIEQDADIVLLLHRPEYYDPNDQPGIAEIIVAKNRNGATGTIKLQFEKKLTRFDNLAAIAEPIDEGNSPF